MESLDVLGNRPKPDYEWLSERIRPPAEAPTSDIKVRLDGFFSPSYADAYMAAWRELIPRATELAIPILYLQRHALELILKDLLGSCLAIRDEMQLGCDVLGLQGPNATATEARVITGHKFEPLINCLARNLEILKLPPLPKEYQQARALLESVEGGDETRLRYHTLKGSWTPSFAYDSKDPKVADIGQLTKLLSTIESEHERFGPDQRDEPVSFIDHVAHLSVSVNDDLVFKLQDLEKATIRGEVVWRLMQTPTIQGGHPNGDALKGGVASSCLATEFEGRRLVLLVVPAYSEDYPHVLGCARDGAVSRLLWPPPYQSNVAFAAIDSWKKHYPRDAES